MEAPLRSLLGRFELLRTDTAQMTVTTHAIVERVDVVRQVLRHQFAVLVDVLLDPFLFKLLKNDSATALSQQLPFRLMLGSSRLDRQKRRHASLPSACLHLSG